MSTNVNDPVVRAVQQRATYYSGQYSLETVVVSTWNYDTTDFYPWLKDRVYEYLGGTASEDRSWVQMHITQQLQMAVERPNSNIGRWIRQFEWEREREEYGSGPAVYWVLLYGPYFSVHNVASPLMPGLTSWFEQLVTDYSVARLRDPTLQSFGDYLSTLDYLPLHTEEGS